MEYSAFRLAARTAFPDLIVSVMMYERGSGTGGEVTMYRVKAQGMPIGAAALTAEAPSGQEAIDALIAKVAPARRQVKAAHNRWLRNRSRQPGHRLAA